MDIDMMTATTIRAMVSMVFSHSPMKPIYRSATEVNARKAQRPTAKETRPRPRITTGHGTHFSPLSIYMSA